MLLSLAIRDNACPVVIVSEVHLLACFVPFDQSSN